MRIRIKVLLPPDENAPADADALHDRSDDPTAQIAPADIVAADGDPSCRTRLNDLKAAAGDLLISDASQVATTQATIRAPEVDAKTEILTLITKCVARRPSDSFVCNAEQAAGGETQLLQWLKPMSQYRYTEQSLLFAIRQLSYHHRARNELFGVVI